MHFFKRSGVGATRNFANFNEMFADCIRLSQYSKYSFKNFEIIKSTSRNNYFYLKIKGNIRKFRNRFIDITYSDNTKNEKLKLIFPFNKLYLKLHKNANIISTMCMNYSNRLDEWLKYNLKLGFDGIVIFNNGNEINSNYIISSLKLQRAGSKFLKNRMCSKVPKC